MIDYFLSIFEKNVDKLALVNSKESITYEELLKIIDSYQNLYTNEVILYISEKTPTFISRFLAFLKNNIVIPIQNPGAYELDEIVEITKPTIIINEYKGTIQKVKSHLIPIYSYLNEKTKSGLVLLTSGTTGKKKAALHSTEKILIKFKRKGKDFTTLLFMNLDHIGGVDTLFYCLANGSKIVIPLNRDILHVIYCIERYKVEVLPVTPSFLNLMIVANVFDSSLFESLKIITFGAERILESNLNILKKKLPGVKFIQKYGTTEIGSLASKSKPNDSTWIKFDGDSTKIRVNNGKLEIKTDTTMLGYLNSENPFTTDGWYKTGDMVVEKDGYLKIIGRESDTINIGGEKVLPSEIENEINKIDYVHDVTIKSESNVILGNILVAEIYSVSTKDENLQIVEIKESLSKRVEKYKVPSKIVFLKEIDKSFKKTRR